MDQEKFKTLDGVSFFEGIYKNNDLVKEYEALITKFKVVTPRPGEKR